MNIPWVRIIITWLLFLPVPIINGALREIWYKQIIGSLAAGQIGSILLSLIFLIYAYLSLRGRTHEMTPEQLVVIGLVWLELTLLFEFGIGLAGGRTWSYMLADYKVWEGRIWPLVLITVFSSPFIVKWLDK
jgi:hypothetical protein